MEKRIIPFYSIVLCVITTIVILLLDATIIMKGIVEDNTAFLPNDGFLQFLFCVFTAIPIVSWKLIGNISIQNDSVSVYKYPFVSSWDKALNNIDFKWNNDFLISEIDNVEIVKLTAEEKKTKVFYKHIFNKYMKINLKHGKCKYIYIGNFTNSQIKKLIILFNTECKTKL